VIFPEIAAADAPRVELIAGSVTTEPDGDVVLLLQIAPLRLNQISGFASRRSPLTWGDVRRLEAALRSRLLTELYLNVDGREVAPSDVTVPDLAGQTDQTALPTFVPVRVVWHNAGLLHAAFSGNSITTKFPSDGITQIQLVLNDNIPKWQVVTRSILIGFEHIVPAGLDHILFVLGIYLAASRFRDLLWQVTSFTIAHSITLGLTLSGIFIVGPFWEQFVEIGIAVSIFAVAFENCLADKPTGWRRILIVGGFGLVHGMGFAGRLSQVKWPAGTFLLSLFGANFGIELGQLAVIAVAALFTAWWWKRPWYQQRVAIPVSLLIGLYGLFAALDRITRLNFPKKDFLNSFWNFYDAHYWSIPFILGTCVLLALWSMYRVMKAVWHVVLARLLRV
jgi:hydrogenase/urease accessory protein HupE